MMNNHGLSESRAGMKVERTRMRIDEGKPPMPVALMRSRRGRPNRSPES